MKKSTLIIASIVIVALAYSINSVTSETYGDVTCFWFDALGQYECSDHNYYNTYEDMESYYNPPRNDEVIAPDTYLWTVGNMSP